jgi:hypothetical protein
MVELNVPGRGNALARACTDEPGMERLGQNLIDGNMSILEAKGDCCAACASTPRCSSWAWQRLNTPGGSA